MYAVIRTGGKQYLVSPGEQLKIERTGTHRRRHRVLRRARGLARRGQVRQRPGRRQGDRHRARQGRGDKILVFKLKRKKQYKKMQGHRQNFVEVRINEIMVNGKSFKAEGDEAAAPKAEKKPAKKAAKKAEAVAE